MIYSLIKWYALTIGAYKYWRWWNSLSDRARFSRNLKKHYFDEIRASLNEPSPLAAMFKAETAGLNYDQARMMNRQVYGEE